MTAHDEGPGPAPGRQASVGSFKQQVERLEDLASVAAHVAEPVQPRRQPQARLGTAGIGDTERQCGADVVELCLEPVEPPGLVPAVCLEQPLSQMVGRCASDVLDEEALQVAGLEEPNVGAVALDGADAGESGDEGLRDARTE